MPEERETQSDRFFRDAGRQAVADPSPLTTQQLLREVTSLKELVFTRLEAMDKAMVLFNDNITRVPTDTDKQIFQLQRFHDEKFHNMAVQFQERKQLYEEKFNSIQVQFKERDIRTEQTSKDGKIAVDAAFQAAKEAVSEQNRSSALAIAKSESATTKQIDQLLVLIQSTTAGLNDKIDDIKSRLILIEGKTVGQKDQVDTQGVSHSNTVAVIGAVIALVVGIGAIIVSFVGK